MTESPRDLVPFTITSALPWSLLALSRAFAQSFEGYLVPIADDPLGFAQRVRSEQIDIAASLLAVAGDEVVGVALIARRGDVARVAALGVVPGWRGQRVGALLLQAALDAARTRGEREMRLEVFEQNEPAVRLYRSLGFAVRRRLVGYERPAGGGETSSLEVGPLVEEPVTMVAREVAGLSDVPWQLDVPSVLASGPQARAVRSGPALALLGLTPDRVVLRAVVVPEHRRGEGHAKRLLQALVAEYADRTWVVPQVVPETWGHHWFIRNGFELQTLSQLEMAVSL